MKKIVTSDPVAHSADVVSDNIHKLKTLFPEVFSEGKINFETLKQLLAGSIEERDEKYGLNWHGKRKARQLALTPSTGTLRPVPKESTDWASTQNLMIEGDNLEVLKLLQKPYAGKVKFIYIDPPYNTGNDFVYPDNYRDNIRNYHELTGQVEGGQKISSNTESSGRYHTDWLNMMLPRLRLARSLLRNDGAIFITIDDNEVANLKLLCDEIFGEENLRSIVSWQKKYSVSNNFKGIATVRDFVLIYSKSELFTNGLLPRDEDSIARYVNPDKDPRGPWKPVDYWNIASTEDRPNLVYAITNPHTKKEIWPTKKAWKFAKETYEGHAAENRIWWGQQGQNSVPALKLFLSDVRDGLIPHNWWPHDEVGHTDEAKKHLDKLFGGSAPFDTPKPIRLIRRMFEIGNVSSDDIVLDFFAGSGATADALMQLNAQDGGARRYILVQLPEPTGRKDYLTIADITKERLRRAGSQLRDTSPDLKTDIGFRVFKLDSSNIRAWDPNRDDMAETLDQAVEHLKKDRTEQDILFELLLKLGLELTVPIEAKTISSKLVHSIGAGVVLACLAEKIEAGKVEALALGIAEWHKALAPAGETQVVFRDSAFSDDVAKSNLTAILLQHGLDNVRSL